MLLYRQSLNYYVIFVWWWVDCASYKINQFAAIPPPFIDAALATSTRLLLYFHYACSFVIIFFYQDANREVTIVQVKF